MTLDTHLVGIAAFLQPSIVEFAAPIKHPLQLFGCVFVRIDAILVGFHAHWTLFCERDGRVPAPVIWCWTLYRAIPVVQASSGNTTFRFISSCCSCGLSASIGPLRYPRKKPMMSNGSLKAMRSKREPPLPSSSRTDPIASSVFMREAI